MYSRAFQDRPSFVPPHYGGTALSEETTAKKEACPTPQVTEEERTPCKETRREEPPFGASLLSRFLPHSIRGEDLLLLGVALLLLLDGCDDEFLPLLLLFLLIIRE